MSSLSLLSKLDAFLQSSDADSMDWADGGGAEDAGEMLVVLSQGDWQQLAQLCAERPGTWRACLASILCPQLGVLAQRLMIQLVWDTDAEVAFLAVSGVAFYCGVNGAANGPFLDQTIKHEDFLQLAKASDGLVDRVRQLSACYNPEFENRFGLLAKVLEPGDRR